MPNPRNSNVPLWEKLNPKFLTTEGKYAVTADPNLDVKTMKSLSKSEASLTKPAKWYFDDVTDGSDVGFAALSLCIDDKPDANMAEIVAIYAKLRHVSFYETACKLCELRAAGSLCRYSHALKSYIPWEPRVELVSKEYAERPPAKRAVCS